MAEAPGERRLSYCPHHGPQLGEEYCPNCGMKMVDRWGVTYEIHGQVEDVLRVHEAIWRIAHASPARADSVYHGPVFYISGEGAQLAWNNKNVVQNRTEQVAPGFEALAEAVATVLQRLPEAELQPEDYSEAEQAANEILAEVTQARSRPDQARALVTQGPTRAGRDRRRHRHE
jgi:hypothetical protein